MRLAQGPQRSDAGETRVNKCITEIRNYIKVPKHILEVTQFFYMLNSTEHEN